jgi:hypothetical protein
MLSLILHRRLSFLFIAQGRQRRRAHPLAVSRGRADACLHCQV